MKKTVSLSLAMLIGAVSFGEAAAQAGAGRGSAPPAAPAPGSAGIFRANKDLQAALAQSIANGGAMASSSITVTAEYRGSIVRRTEPNGAIQHPGNTEMHYIVEGSGTVVTGGTVVRREGLPAAIEGGEAHRVVKGDIIIIPAGSAHMYSEIVEPITYLEFRFVAPD
jgi:mannose-6-phosphate isomerase-like protein (cupin superfamily)